MAQDDSTATDLNIYSCKDTEEFYYKIFFKDKEGFYFTKQSCCYRP